MYRIKDFTDDIHVSVDLMPRSKTSREISDGMPVGLHIRQLKNSDICVLLTTLKINYLYDLDSSFGGNVIIKY
jgi:hypothetical protein